MASGDVLRCAVLVVRVGAADEQVLGAQPFDVSDQPVPDDVAVNGERLRSVADAPINERDVPP